MQAVLFDLDGTLADTAPDLGGALNALRLERGLPALPLAVLRPVASHGARGMLAAGFDLTPDEADFVVTRQRFLQLYEQRLCTETTLFAGVRQLLDELNARGFAWGIVTNKPTAYTLPLLAHLGLHSTCVVCGDSCEYPKPHPAPMYLAAERLGVPPHACWYVGDAQRDMDAARTSGMYPVLARYGYIADRDTPESWGAALEIANPLALLTHLPAQAISC